MWTPGLDYCCINAAQCSTASVRLPVFLFVYLSCCFLVGSGFFPLHSYILHVNPEFPMAEAPRQLVPLPTLLLALLFRFIFTLNRQQPRLCCCSSFSFLVWS